MRKTERQNGIINIENAASFIASEIGLVVMDSILNRFGAGSTEDISDFDLSDVFGDLYAIEADLKSG